MFEQTILDKYSQEMYKAPYDSLSEFGKLAVKDRVMIDDPTSAKKSVERVLRENVELKTRLSNTEALYDEAQRDVDYYAGLLAESEDYIKELEDTIRRLKDEDSTTRV